MVQTESYDVVVVGCGWGGTAAALSAAEKGASVAILEKAPKDMRGGQTRYASTTRIPTAEVDVDLDFHTPDYTSSDFYQDIMRVTEGFADPDLASTLTSNTAEAFEWLTDHLYEYDFQWETQPTGKNEPEGKAWYSGTEAVATMLEAATDLGADVYYEAEARELIQDGSKGPDAVKAFVKGEEVHFESDAVVIACGGFESNAEKRTQYFGDNYEQMTVRGVRYNTGEAIDMALDIGASSTGQWSGAHMAIIDAASPKYEGGQTMPRGYQFGIIINHEGERFVDEGEDTRSHTYAKFGRRIFEQPYHEAFVIWDDSTVDHLRQEGPTDPVTADSIETLVERVGIENTEQAIETFLEYNEACDPDVDEVDPSKLDGNSTTSDIDPPKSNWAKALNDKPLHAIPVTGGITFTFGGLEHNSEAAVLDTSHEPIPGLYAAGNTGGGLLYKNYPGGTASTKAYVFGKIAGENAAEEALN